eukprot:513292-Lingulodinium_polyedra.AAC.1
MPQGAVAIGPDRLVGVLQQGAVEELPDVLLLLLGEVIHVDHVLVEAAFQQARRAVLHLRARRILSQPFVVRPGGQISSTSRLRSTAGLVGSSQEGD